MVHLPRDGDGTHYKKLLTPPDFTARGMKPIEKNVIVVDENGNKYEATYPKRAKGLVKNGRARFIDENTICLLCPPQNETEDKIMSENIIAENTQVAASPAAENEKYTLDYCLTQIEKIREQTEYLNGVISELGAVKSECSGDIAMSAKAQSLGEVVKCRETTNQKLLAFYEKMYDDLKEEKKTRSSAGNELVDTYLKVINATADPETKLDLTDGLHSYLLDMKKAALAPKSAKDKALDVLLESAKSGLSGEGMEYLSNSLAIIGDLFKD